MSSLGTQIILLVLSCGCSNGKNCVFFFLLHAGEEDFFFYSHMFLYGEKYAKCDHTNRLFEVFHRKRDFDKNPTKKGVFLLHTTFCHTISP